MSFISNVADIKLMQNLLCPPEDDDSDLEDDRLPSTGTQKIGPGQIGKSDSKSDKKSGDFVDKYKKIEAAQPTSIEQWEEMQEKEAVASGWDHRKIPEFKISYRQSVTTEDVFLQMGNKTGATASCEDMIIEISLPNEKMKIHEMELSVARAEITLVTKLYKLHLPLAHPVDPDKGNAGFDVEKQVMKLVLRLDREFDFVNF